MKKIGVLIIILSFFAAAFPAFAQSGSTHEPTLFQIVYDSIVKADQEREKKPWGDITLFEEVQSNLQDLDAASRNAKALSLRKNKSKLAKRKYVK
ncbi:MAG: hypothetical protein NG740_01810 [Omnitrophica bacterium]|nr:hypothetical protein [Candidatus Omnitrophota bacterium]